ncbi:Thermonuclease [subsurface metagenome]
MEEYGIEAWEANRRLVEGKEVRLERDVTETDKYGRLLRYVYVGDVFVNAELVRQGLAEAKAYPPDTKYQDYLEKLEAEARLAGRGMWAK